MNYIGTKGTNLLMRRNIAQALPFDPANPQSSRPASRSPNFVVYIDSDFSGESNYNAMNAKFERHTSSFAATASGLKTRRSTDGRRTALANRLAMIENCRLRVGESA